MFRISQTLATLSLVAALALAGCVPITPTPDAGSTVPAATATERPGTIPGPTVDATATAIIEEGGAVATVATRSLRVRALPTSASTQLGSILNAESYRVVARSSDGMWLELEIPALGGSGWVAADLVTMAGDITDLPIVEVPTPVPPTPTPVLVLPTATPSAAEPAAPLTATVATTESVATAEAPVPAEPATPTAAPVVEPSAPVTETVPAEATPAVEPPVATPTPTAAPIIPPPAGFVAVNAEVRLRVRSEPTTDGENIVGYAYPGEVFQVVEQSADGAWTRIAGSTDSRENPTGGWVTSEFLLFGQ